MAKSEKNAQVFFQGRLDEKYPQRIIKFFRGTFLIKERETIHGVFGYVNTMNGMGDSVVALWDRLEYVDMRHIWPKNHTYFYTDIDHFSLSNEKGFAYITINFKSGERAELKIKAAIEETNKFYNFLKDMRPPDEKLQAVEAQTGKCPGCGAGYKIIRGTSVECAYCGTRIDC